VNLRFLLRLLFFVALSFSVGGAFASTRSMAKPSPTKHRRAIVAYSGKISRIKNGRDRKKKRYWEYRLRTAKGETILVHDYQFGRYRQPASVGIREGAKKNVRGFFVHISTKLGDPAKHPVLVIPPSK
jgi:hypothetical protein